MGWNYGDIYDAVAKTVPADARALTHCDERGEAVRSFSWAEFTRRTNNLARNLSERDVATGVKVAFYMRNSPAYPETLVACFKGRFTHVNVNYRYLDDELWYILDNSDAEVVVYGSEFVDHVREHLAGYKTPKRVLAMGNLGRAANGKPDYKAVTEYAKRELGIVG